MKCDDKNNTIKVLIADDESMYRELVSDILKRQGYETLEAADGQEALDLFFEEQGISLLILDVMMPRYDGWEVLKEIREQSDVPIIMLTALGDETHEVVGLNGGANDYISKPFSYEVFVARVNTLLRNLVKEQKQTLLVGGLELNQASRRVTASGQEVELNRKEYNLLAYFIHNQGQVLDREQILSNIWGYDYDGDIRTVDTHVKMLRSKLKECGRYVQTVRGSGYLFEVVDP